MNGRRQCAGGRQPSEPDPSGFIRLRVSLPSLRAQARVETIIVDDALPNSGPVLKNYLQRQVSRAFAGDASTILRTQLEVSQDPVLEDYLVEIHVSLIDGSRRRAQSRHTAFAHAVTTAINAVKLELMR